jgi:aminocarboxymuconate-semialdehyde decarboxylase
LARRFWYDALVFDPRALRYLIDMLGPSQLLLGTDFPAMAREQPADATLRSLGLDAATHDAIAGGNCLRFLGIERGATPS